SADAQPLPHHCTPPRHDALPISPIKIDMTSRQKGSKDIKPDESRVRQLLEGFNIETFEMVGTLGGEGSVYGLVKGAGGVHRVKRSEEHTSELQSREKLVCRLLRE